MPKSFSAMRRQLVPCIAKIECGRREVRIVFRMPRRRVRDDDGDQQFSRVFLLTHWLSGDIPASGTIGGECAAGVPCAWCVFPVATRGSL